MQYKWLVSWIREALIIYLLLLSIVFQLSPNPYAVRFLLNFMVFTYRKTNIIMV